MTDPAMASTVNGTRWYRNPNRHEGALVYRGVTGITSALPKEAIPRWAAKTVAEYAVSYVNQWTELPAWEALDLLKNVPWRNRDRAAARGTEVHKVIEGLIQGLEYDVEAELEPWINAARAFVESARPEPEAMERTVYNERHLHAGTFDFLGRLRQFPELGRVLIDWKTSKGIYPDMGVQVVGGYALGGEYALDEAGKEVDWVRPDSAAVVHLTERGYEIRPVPMDQIFRRAFLAALEIRKWQTDGPKIGPALVPVDPGQERFELAYLQAELVQLKSRIRALDPSVGLVLHTWCNQQNIPTKLSELDTEQYDLLLGVVRLAERGLLPHVDEE